MSIETNTVQYQRDIVMATYNKIVYGIIWYCGTDINRVCALPVGLQSITIPRPAPRLWPFSQSDLYHWNTSTCKQRTWRPQHIWCTILALFLHLTKLAGNRSIMRQHVHHCHYNLLLLLLCAEQTSSATSLSGFCRPSHPGAVHQVGPLGIESLCHFNLELPKSPQYASPSALIFPRYLIELSE